jgi:hypothetical protein
VKTLIATLFAIALATGNVSAQGTIGPANGVSYRVVSSHEVVKMDAARCGYHDLSLPNGGVFRVETRVYSEYSNGKLLRTWTQEAETFVRCYEP